MFAQHCSPPNIDLDESLIERSEARNPAASGPEGPDSKVICITNRLCQTAQLLLQPEELSAADIADSLLKQLISELL